jgi:ABC-2 type transport system permease protein
VTVLVVATSLLLGASWGNPWGVGMLIVAGVLAATGITSVVASLARTAEQAGSWQAVVAVTLGMLGGAFFPIQQSGSFMATAWSRRTPGSCGVWATSRAAACPTYCRPSRPCC